ncbi:MAG TPA: DUF3551 domain-containing protein [Patescibacteria group bacterium]|nr:DUF3551 domain-containing protein [Patescibacteria group bacterium]
MSLGTKTAGALLAAMLLTGQAARASDFCVVGMAIPPQCYYDDVKACMGAATPPNTFCGVNPEARLMYYGSSRYCVVHSAKLAECMYEDYLQCSSAAGQAGAICADRNQKKDDINPFRYDRRIEN